MTGRRRIVAVPGRWAVVGGGCSEGRLDVSRWDVSGLSGL